MMLLTGVTGTVGQAIVGALPRFDLEARALTRDPKNSASLEAAGLEVVIGDLRNKRSLRSALEGAEQAFLLSSNNDTQAEVERNFIDEARDAGVAHVIKMSAVGADVDSPAILKRIHGEVERHLESSGMNYTHIRPNFFMQNMLNVVQTIQAENKFFMPMGEGQVGAIDVRDVAEAVLCILTNPGHESKHYDISGPGLLSFADMAKQFSQALGRHIEYVNVPNEDFKREMSKWGMDTWYTEAVSELFQGISENRSAFLTGTYREITGILPRTFASFVVDYASRFGTD